MNLTQALVWNVGTFASDGNGKVTSGDPARAKVQMRRQGAEQPVVAMKLLKGSGAKGLNYPVLFDASTTRVGGTFGQNKTV